MKGISLLIVISVFSASVFGQKKTLDHLVYDGWQSIGERSISNNGKFTAYVIAPQEGDGTLVIQATDNSYKKEIPRGYAADITADNRYVVFRIRPFFRDTREARIKKKSPAEMPKDSVGVLELGKDSILKFASVKSFKMPEKGNGEWLAYLFEKNSGSLTKPGSKPDSLTQLNNLSKMADSLVHIADSLRNKVSEVKTKGFSVLKTPAAPRPNRNAERVDEGTELVLYNLKSGKEIRYTYVKDYLFSKNGNVLLLETSARNADTTSFASVIWVDLKTVKTDTILRKFNDARSFAFDEEATQLAFNVERDSSSKAQQKFFKLYYFKTGMDTALKIAERTTPGIQQGYTVSDSTMPEFSKDGKRLFLGLSQIRQPKDTTIPDFEAARLDVWHYNDDYLQPQQLKQLRIEMGRSYKAVMSDDKKSVIALGATDAENIYLVDEGNADFVVGVSSKGNRIESQWQGFAKQTAFTISLKDASRKIIKEKHRGQFMVSPKGKYVTWYDGTAKHYFAYNVKTGATKNISKKITLPLYDDEDDHPDDPPSFGTIGWLEDDAALLINDRYDIWQLDPDDSKAPVNITAGFGRKNRIVLNYIRTDREKRFLDPKETLLLSAFNRNNKDAGFYSKKLGTTGDPVLLSMGAYSFSSPLKAKDADVYLVSRMTPQQSPDVYSATDLKSFTKLSEINQQQKDYNWFTAELVKWKMFDGKMSEGLVFKPENFDPKKKYPVIFYFYEQDADGLNNYRAPAPSASTINIPYFVSNGYIVMDPNIHYKTGEPGESAYNSVVSAAKFMSKFPWVDSTKMAIQGQSWGGYQVAYLVTRTNIFAAAGAGAPVANMTSAYGGIRWGTGLNRQFQYERSQTRIGSTLWERPDLYIKNSPLFKVDKIKTPLLIMHNDADGAVPWYQGIEMFTAMRRLGKKAWLLQYNGEDHNLVERRNRKDLSVRLGQFFDYYLKGAAPAKWISEGVPAVVKGVDYGL